MNKHTATIMIALAMAVTVAGCPIDTAEQLQLIGNDPDYPLDGKYYLTRDIDASGIDWQPIGSDMAPFTGVLDGAGYTIHGLTIDKPESDYVGMFGYSVGTVKNVTVTGASVEGRDAVGIIAGMIGGLNLAGAVINCRAEGKVYAGSLSGGIAGVVYIDSEIQDSTAFIDVAARTNSGGIVGDNLGVVARCTAYGTVSGHNILGGICGANPGRIEDCESFAIVSGYTLIGGAVGYLENMGLAETGRLIGTNARGKTKGDGQYIGELVGYAAPGTIIEDCWPDNGIGEAKQEGP